MLELLHRELAVEMQHIQHVWLVEQDLVEQVDGWVILGNGGRDMVIGRAGPTVVLAGGGVPSMVIHFGGGNKIIGGAGCPAGAPGQCRADLTTISNTGTAAQGASSGNAAHTINNYHIITTTIRGRVTG
jgi:hypothetical protein